MPEMATMHCPSGPRQAGSAETSSSLRYNDQNKCLGTTGNSNKPTVFAFKELGGSRDTLTDVSSYVIFSI